MDWDWTEKSLLLPGGTTGIGRGAAVGIAEAGADIVVLGRSHDPEDTCKAIRALGRKAVGFQGDVCDGTFGAQLVNGILAQWGRLSIMVNSAGLQIRGPSVDYAEADWDKVIDLNLTALFCMRCSRSARWVKKRRRFPPLCMGIRSGKLVQNVVAAQTTLAGAPLSCARLSVMPFRFGGRWAHRQYDSPRSTTCGTWHRHDPAWSADVSAFLENPLFQEWA
jgi:NAD(P)-dependent dehydrogenase (short-subunit alcohol dehydrogenase family)